MAISNRVFQDGDRVVVTHGNVRYLAKVTTTDPKPLFRLVEPKEWEAPESLKAKGGKDGRTFTLGNLEAAITFPKHGPNRYLFFTRLEDEKAEAKVKADKVKARATKKESKAADKEKAATERAAKKEAKATEKTAKASRRNRRNGGYQMIKAIEEAPNTYWCDGCMESFVYTGELNERGLPPDCPNGHVGKGIQAEQDVGEPAPAETISEEYSDGVEVSDGAEAEPEAEVEPATE